MNKNNPFFRQEDHSSPEKLSEVSTIDILILGGRGALEGMRILDDAPHKLIEGQAAQEIANLFRQLPSGNPARCHTPPFGLRFYTVDGLQSQCSICWECNNIYGDFRYDFDADHSISQKLLALLIQLAK